MQPGIIACNGRRCGMTMMALFIFAGALIADSISPGPTVAALVARVLSRGAHDVLPFLIAIESGDMDATLADIIGRAIADPSRSAADMR